MRKKLYLLLVVSFVLIILTKGAFYKTVEAEEIGQTTTNNQNPHLLITELVPNSNKGSDRYEFVELYNSTDRMINLKDYQIQFKNRVIQLDNTTIEAGNTVVVWVTNGHENATLTGFNNHYGVNLNENQVIRKDNHYLSDSHRHDLQLTTNTGYKIVKATYNKAAVDVALNKGIFYKFPEAGSMEMRKLSGGIEAPTPGVVETNQIPDQLIPVDADTISPTITNQTVQTEAVPTENFEIIASVQDDQMVKDVTIFYKTKEQENYMEANVAMNKGDSLYHYIVSFPDVLASDFIEYYFTASDGSNNATSEVYKINVNRENSSPRLNVVEQDIVTGETIIKGTADGVNPKDLKLYVDGVGIANTHQSIEKKAYFVFDTNGSMNWQNKNTVTLDKEILHIMDKSHGSNLQGNRAPIMVPTPIVTESLHQGTNTLAIRSGSSNGTYFEGEHPGGNLDDFNAWNVRLILVDGTVLRDPAYNEYMEPTKKLRVGDSNNTSPFYKFNFDIPSEKLVSSAYLWDTTSVSDGEHTVKVVAPDGSVATSTVLVDNTVPSITTTLEDGKTYKGNFVIDPKVSDDISGLEYVNVTLDGKVIDVPFQTSSAELEPGEHVLTVKAAEKVRLEDKMPYFFDEYYHTPDQENLERTIEKTVSFYVEEENPGIPEIVSPIDGATNVDNDPILSVNVTDPTNDDLNISFYQGQKYTVENKKDFVIYKGETDIEPPLVIKPEGETQLPYEEYAKLREPDGKYITQDSTKKFPYLRFEVQVGNNLDQNDRVELKWEGKSLDGRKVTMYAWNHDDEKWVSIDTIVAATEDNFTLKGNVDVANYVRNQAVDVLVQDLISPPEDYDYTFVMMPDTQYYSEMRPEIFRSQVEWIRDNKDAMNIEYVFHVGDLVDGVLEEYQWEYASDFMGVLDNAKIPYGVLAGNHDVGGGVGYAMFQKYFGADRFKDKPYYGESYQDNRGHYDLISSNGNDYIMVHMGWFGDDYSGIEWLNDVLAQYPNRKAILSFHQYLNQSGNRTSIGNRLFGNVVVPNENVVMVLSGHLTGSAKRLDQIDDNGDGVPDRRVYQILSDYQDKPQGGAGYMKLLHFDVESGKINVNTYSPYLDDYNFYNPDEHPGKDAYTLDFDLEPEIKRVATDYFEVNVYKDNLIGKTENSASGENAEVEWKDLGDNQTYYWYSIAEDHFGGKVVSEIQGFTTGEELLAPESLQITEKTATTVDLSWQKQIDEDDEITFEIFMDGEKITTTEDVVYTVEELQPGTEYQFTVIAVDDDGARSKPSNQITVTTLMNLAEVRNIVDGYIDSNEISGPLAKQLSNKLKQAEHFYNKGSIDKARKHMEDFLQKVNKAKHISEEARDILNKKVKALITTGELK